MDSVFLIILGGVLFALIVIVTFLVRGQIEGGEQTDSLVRLSRRLSELEHEREKRWNDVERERTADRKKIWELENEIRKQDIALVDAMRIISWLLTLVRAHPEIEAGRVPPLDVEAWLRVHEKKARLRQVGDKVIELRKAISERFSMQEMEELIMDTLGISPEEIAGKTPSERAANLVFHCQRHGIIDQLILKCQEERPFLDWPV